MSEKSCCVDSIPQSYQKQQVRSDEIVSFKHNIQLNAYPIRFVNCYQQTQEKFSSEEGGEKLGFLSISYTRGVSEKFKRVVNRYNIKTVFRKRHTL